MGMGECERSFKGRSICMIEVEPMGVRRDGGGGVG